MATIILYLVLFGNVLTILGFWLGDHLLGPSGNLFATSWMESALACGRLAGLLAVCALLLQLVLAGRVKWVERVFGLDRLFRVHHWNGFAVIALALWLVHGRPLVAAEGSCHCRRHWHHPDSRRCAGLAGDRARDRPALWQPQP